MNTNSEKWRDLRAQDRMQFSLWVLDLLEEQGKVVPYDETFLHDPLLLLAEGLIDALFNCFFAMKQRSSLLQDKLVAQSAHMSQSEPKETP